MKKQGGKIEYEKAGVGVSRHCRSEVSRITTGRRAYTKSLKDLYYRSEGSKYILLG